VDSIEPVRNVSGITSEWFGLVLLPFVSFSADGAVAAGYFCHKTLRRVWSKTKDPGDPPSTLAKAEAIDLSIQFILLWMPFLTLLGWWTGKPFSLLFGALPTSLMLLPIKTEEPIRFLRSCTTLRCLLPCQFRNCRQ
jgi:Ca2+:H+ antiporter